MRIGCIALGFLLGLVCVQAQAVSDTALTQTPVFTAGQEGYHTYRIPAIVCTNRGTLLAFCEGRKLSSADTGQNELVLKRSTDNGATWSPLQMIVSGPDLTINNPAPVVDRNTGTIWLVFTAGNAKEGETAILMHKAPARTVWTTCSKDDGCTWADAKEIASTASLSSWRWYATGPCHGIQLSNGTLMVPCNHSNNVFQRSWKSHVIFSTDRGETWQRGGSASAYTNEPTRAELSEGRLYLNMRSYKKRFRRAIAHSTDLGKTWRHASLDKELIEPVCQASCLVYSTEKDAGKNRLLFSNPASVKRKHMTVRMSYNDGRTWNVLGELHAGPAAYSDLVRLKDKTIGCLYECGEEHAYETITFARFSLGWLTSGKDNGE
jgi:sialidase-1